MINAGIMSSNHSDWETPQEFFDGINGEFRFDVDVCAQAHNTKCQIYFTPEMDGLKQEWNSGKIYCGW